MGVLSWECFHVSALIGCDRRSRRRCSPCPTSCCVTGCLALFAFSPLSARVTHQLTTHSLRDLHHIPDDSIQHITHIPSNPHNILSIHLHTRAEPLQVSNIDDHVNLTRAHVHSRRRLVSFYGAEAVTVGEADDGAERDGGGQGCGVGEEGGGDADGRKGVGRGFGVDLFNEAGGCEPRPTHV